MYKVFPVIFECVLDHNMMIEFFVVTTGYSKYLF